MCNRDHDPRDDYAKARKEQKISHDYRHATVSPNLPVQAQLGILSYLRRPATGLSGAHRRRARDRTRRTGLKSRIARLRVSRQSIVLMRAPPYRRVSDRGGPTSDRTEHTAVRPCKRVWGGSLRACQRGRKRARGRMAEQNPSTVYLDVYFRQSLHIAAHQENIDFISLIR